jgi:aspartate kinase
MSLIVQKYGGTSVANPEKILAAARRAVAAHRVGHQVVLVVSARGKKTDELLALANEITNKPSQREMDMLLSVGEQESVALVTMAIHTLGVKAVSLTGGQIGILTDSSFTKARIRQISTDRLKKHLKEGAIVVACGFQGVDEEGNITTLGRGGSDTTATALAAALHANECQIYTDVDGVFTTDPRVIPEARLIPQISYDEMLELASLGAGVMHSRSIEFAKKFGVHLRVRPSYSENPGTLIAPENGTDARVVTGLAMIRSEARVSLCDIPDRPGVMSSIFTKLASRKIAVDMVVQNVGVGGTAEVSFTVPESDLAEALTAAHEAVRQLGKGTVQSGTNLSKVSAVGVGMRTHSGVAAQMFRSLADADINIEMITTSEIKVSTLIDRDRCDDAMRAIHAGFRLHEADETAPAIGVKQKGTDSRASGSDAELLKAVVSKLSHMEEIVVSEVTLDESQSRITIASIPDVPGVCAEIFSAIAEGDVMVDMIVQDVSREGQTRVSFTVEQQDLDRALLLVREVISGWKTATVSSDRQIAKLSVAGIGLRSHTDVGQRMFQSLADAGVNVQMINTSEIRMSVVVKHEEGPAAHRALLECFGLG